MNRTTRATLLSLAGILAACAPAGGEAADPTQPMASTDAEPATSAVASADPSDAASTAPAASHDMGGMSGETVTVEIANFAFVQGEIEISVGDTVEWVNGDAARHTVTSGTDDTADGTFDSGDVEAGETFRFTFTEAGEYAYFCDIHPTMTGVVVVRP
jgi:plastocyanin